MQKEARKADEADKTRQADEAAAKARKDVEDKKIIQAEQDIKFKEVLESDEAKNLEQTAKDVLKDNSAFKDLKAKTKGILNSGMSPEKQQEALNNLAGETQKVMAYALQQPAMQQAVKSLQRRSTFSNGGVPVEEKSLPAKNVSGAEQTNDDSPDDDDSGGGFFGRVFSSIWGGVVGFIDSPIGTTLSLASSVIGIPGAVMDMMTGMFKTDTGQEALFRNVSDLEVFQDNPFLDKETADALEEASSRKEIEDLEDKVSFKLEDLNNDRVSEAEGHKAIKIWHNRINKLRGKLGWDDPEVQTPPMETK